jgi:hypothetical protein
MEASHHIRSLQTVIDHVSDVGGWIVVVAPTGSGEYAELLRMMVGLLPPEASMCGRTTLFPNGGKVTVCGATGRPHGEGYRVLFLGFGDSLTPADEIAFHSWRSAAKGVVGLGDNSRELKGL